MARQLNVRDALAYLDDVKAQFAKDPESAIYQNFLNVMRDFKCQTIDTPGVIDRVSTLFRGHPILIQNFNTFLPAGFRLECSSLVEGAKDNIITVHTPLGVIRRTESGEKIEEVRTGAAAAPSAPSSARPSPAPTPAPPAASAAPVASSSTAAAARQAPKPAEHLPLPPPPTLASLQKDSPIATPGAVSLLSSHLAQPTAATASGAAAAVAAASSADRATPDQAAAPTAGSSSGSDVTPRPLMEFNHAINYVNKIKNRFVRDPETYKAFLEILQTYQREGKAIQDVYAQVTTLFHAAPDLLDEFKQFLPEEAPPPAWVPQPKEPAASTSRVTKRPAVGTAAKGKDDGGSAKRPRVTKSVAAPPVKIDGRKRAAREEKAALEEAKAMGPSDPYAYPAPYATGSYGYGYDQPVAPPAPVVAPPPPLPLLKPKPQASAGDSAFFQRAKIFFADVPTYHEFLKLVNLYTQELIDLPDLVNQAHMFLSGDAALWRDFKDIVGWTEGRPLGDPTGGLVVHEGERIIENVPRKRTEGRVAQEKFENTKEEDAGPSYKRLPKSEIVRQCSGRDSLCWDVLNDEWISLPTPASDEGYLYQRKNQYEEALQRSEEERHEYDFHIEANLRTIGLLEPLAAKIALMDETERKNYRMKHGLVLGQGRSIYQRIVKKVYGREQGAEVIKTLHERPSVAIPIVLARLKQKDDEWKRSLREWNRVWREVDAKNFWKSLDHKAISLKANDKRTLTAKALVTEIECYKRKQMLKHAGNPAANPKPTHQLRYKIESKDVVFDVVKLAITYLEWTNSIPYAEKDNIETLLRNYTQQLFALGAAEIAAELMPNSSTFGVDDDDSLDGQSDAGASVLDDHSDAPSTSSGPAKRGGYGGRGRGGPSDLRKRALKNAVGPGSRGVGGGRRANGKGGTTSRGASPALSVGTATADEDAQMTDAGATPRAESVQPEGTPSRPASPTGVIAMAAAAPVSTLPEIIIPVDDRPARLAGPQRWNFFANSGLYCMTRLLQLLVERFATLKKLADEISLAHPVVAGNLYEKTLQTCESYLQGGMDQAAFEDAMRRAFGLQVYAIFTVEKILSNIIKLAQTANNDIGAQELLDLAKKDRAHSGPSTPEQQISYRSAAEGALGPDEHLYRLEWNALTNELSFQLVGKDSVADEDAEIHEREWLAYIESFVSADPTPGIKADVPYLKRNLRKVAPSGTDTFPEHIKASAGLQGRVCIRSYRMFYVTDSEDVMLKKRGAAGRALSTEQKKAAKERFDQWAKAKMDKAAVVPMETDPK